MPRTDVAMNWNAFSKFSANVCSVTVLPVPVAPVISPWRLASPAAARSGVGSFRDQHRFSHEGAR
jgi:hypothetical protein